MKKRYYFLTFTLIGLSLTSCEQPKSFQEIELIFKNSNAIEERSLNQQTDARTLDRTNNLQETRTNRKFDRTPKSPEEVWIVVWMWRYCLVCYLLVWKFRGREEANRMLRRIRRRVK